MFQNVLKSSLLTSMLLSSAGCMTCYDPCNTCAPCGPYMPWDSQYCGAVETGPLGTPRPGLAQRREMRRALHNTYGFTSCPTCNTGTDGGFDQQYGAMSTGSSCPTCQQNQQMAPQMMSPQYPQYMDQGGMQSMPVPAPSIDAAVPAPQQPVPTPAAPSTTYYQPGAGGTYAPPQPMQAYNNFAPQPVYNTQPVYSPQPVYTAPPVQQTLYAP